MAAGKRRAIDGFRRARVRAREACRDRAGARGGAGRGDGGASRRRSTTTIGDELLGLIFVACHPVLAPRGAGGADAAADRRADHRGDRAGLSWRASRPSRSGSCGRRRRCARRGWASRCRGGRSCGRGSASVLEVVYLIFNEGYAATAGEDLVRPALCAEAQRLGRVLAGLMPEEPEVLGLLALMELQASRLAARVGRDGAAVPLHRAEPGALGPAADRAAAWRRWRGPRRWAGRAGPMRCRRRSRPAMRGRGGRRRRTGGGSRGSTTRWRRRCRRRWWR